MASRDELPRLRWVRSTVPGVWEVLPADQTSFQGGMSDEDICDGVEIEVTHFSLYGVAVLGKRTREDEDEVQKVQYTVTGPSTVARELTLFTLQVWAMIQAEVRNFKEAIADGDKQHGGFKPDVLDADVSELCVTVTVVGCAVTPHPTGKIQWRRERGLRIASSDHNVRVPPSFEGNEFECCVTIFEEREPERRIFERHLAAAFGVAPD